MEFSSSEKRPCILILLKITSKASHDVRLHSYGIGAHFVIISLTARIFLPNLAYNLRICCIILTKNTVCVRRLCAELGSQSHYFLINPRICSENIGADQLCGYRKADLRLCFSICKTLIFSWRGSIKLYNGCHLRDHLTIRLFSSLSLNYIYI